MVGCHIIFSIQAEMLGPHMREAKHSAEKLETDNAISLSIPAGIICTYHITPKRQTRLFFV